MNENGSSNGEHGPDAAAGGEVNSMDTSQGDTTVTESPERKSGIFGTASNMVNSIVGAGIIGIPYAFSQSGLVSGLVLLALVGFLTDRSLRVIIDLASFHPQLRRCNVRTYEELASFPFGRWGRLFVLANMSILAYGAMVAYLLIIKDTVPTILFNNHEDTFVQRELILIIASTLVILPLSMIRDMAWLATTSFLSVMADVLLTVFVAVYSPIESTVSEAGGVSTVIKDSIINPTLFVGLGILSTALACQHSAFIVSGSLQNKTRQRWATVTKCSIASATALCAVFGVAGYLGYLDDTQGDILNNFRASSTEANSARTLLAITMLFTYPMESFVLRHVLLILISGDSNGSTEQRSQGGFLCMNQRESFTLAIFLAAMLPALILDDLGPVLSITGSLGGSCISYLAPGLIFLGVNGDAFLQLVNAKLSKSMRKPTGALENGEGIELPVAGDASQKIPSTAEAENGKGDAELPAEGKKITMVTSVPTGCKPLWYYLGGFPLWCLIATRASARMKVRVAAAMANPNAPPASNQNEDDDLPSPGWKEFGVALFFINFGILGVVAGMASNFYVQWHNPH